MCRLEVKHSLNDTVGTFQDKPLNRLVSEFAYDSFYNTAKILSSKTDKEAGIIEFFHKGLVSLSAPDVISKLKVETAIIPWGVKTLKKGLFTNCSSLNEVILPNTVENIEGTVFLNNALKTIFIPSSIKEIGKNTFQSCENLTHIYIDRPKNDALSALEPWGAPNATIHYSDESGESNET